MRVDIHVTAGPAKGQHFTFEEPSCFLFGRSEDAHISLPNDPYVSRQHFSLEISPPQCKLVDLNSKNGVFVNGMRYGGRKAPAPGIRQAPHGKKEVQLHDGDEIIVGDSCIMLSMQHKSEEERQRNLRDNLRKKLPRFPKIAGYRIEQKLGPGKMGVIYKGRHQKSGRDVAIKTVLPRVTIDRQKIRRFQQELAVIRQLRHEHIVQLLDYGEADDYFYFVFEFTHGINLSQFVQMNGGVLPLKNAAPIMPGILSGLAYAHRAKISVRTVQGKQKKFCGIVHQDLKPQNILLMRRGDAWFPKITDFGLSRGFEVSGLTNITSPEDMLRAPMYWPREQITHYDALEPASDVFAVAAIFYEMLTGFWVRDGFQALFDRVKRQKRLPSISEYLKVILTSPVVPIQRRQKDIPEPVAEVLNYALTESVIPREYAKMRQALHHVRYPDAGAFRRALVRALNECGISPPSETFNQASGSARERVRPKKPTSPGAVVYSTIESTVRRDVALLVLDIEQSTRYVLDKGDTSFSTLIGNMYRHVKEHASALDLLLLKCTGDGFLLAYATVQAAYSLAESFLPPNFDEDIRIRMALHWGTVRVGPDGDILGTEVLRILQIEGLTKEDQVTSVHEQHAFPDADRILITQEGLDRLHPPIRRRFLPAGAFRLKALAQLCDIWISSRKNAD